MNATKPFSSLEWIGGIDGHLRILDQTRLPGELTYFDCLDEKQLWQAIKSLQVRGAPAIGIAAAYGVCLGMKIADCDDEERFFQRLNDVVAYLASARPTAVNLFWALGRMKDRALSFRGTCSPKEIQQVLLEEAMAIHEEDRAICRGIGHWGSTLLKDGMGVLTHCNAGALATSELGTALAAIYTAAAAGKKLSVFADETRPLLQGARLTTWELTMYGIPVTLICDNMAAQVMREGKVQAVIVGADRIAANGDTANKIGTYGVAVLAKAHGIPFYVAAPSSTFDLSLPHGGLIPIEQRSPEEVSCPFGKPIAPASVQVYNPAFDVTPAELITAIIYEKGIISPVDEAAVRAAIEPLVGTRKA
jgi:methylthioribose-1-phosphate isomerase